MASVIRTDRIANPTNLELRPRALRLPQVVERSTHLGNTGACARFEFPEQIRRILGNDDEAAMLRAEEPLLRRMVEKRQQRIEVSGHVEDAVRLPVQTELPPRPDFEELFEAAQAAGKKHEGIGKLGHLLFALVHRVDDAELGELPDGRLRDRAGAGE